MIHVTAFLVTPLSDLDDGEVPYGRIIFWSLALIGFILALFAAITYLKRTWFAPEEPVGTGFSLGDLRALHRSGKMTDEEFERAKAQIIAGYKGAALRDAAAARPAPPSDEPIEDEPPAPSI